MSISLVNQSIKKQRKNSGRTRDRVLSLKQEIKFYTRLLTFGQMFGASGKFAKEKRRQSFKNPSGRDCNPTKKLKALHCHLNTVQMGLGGKKTFGSFCTLFGSLQQHK